MIVNFKEWLSKKRTSLFLDENTPQSGESSGSPAEFKKNSKPDIIKFLTIDEIINNVKNIPYYRDVLSDVIEKDYSWSVTKKVLEYANYMIKNPKSIKNLPPIIVVDGGLQDGAHRISAIYLIKNLLDKKNNFWGNLKLKIEFWSGKNLEKGNYSLPLNYNRINEIKRTTSLVDGKVDYNQFVDWAKTEADKITKLIDKFSGLGFQWAENSEGVKLIIYNDDLPVGYVGLNKFNNGYKISTLGVKDSARGLGVSTKAYEYIIKNHTLYSDKMQTPEAMKLWINLYRKHKIMGYNQKNNEYFDVKPNGNELVSTNPKYELYSNKENKNYLVIL
jgi:hypothetical protein